MCPVTVCTYTNVFQKVLQFLGINQPIGHAFFEIQDVFGGHVVPDHLFEITSGKKTPVGNRQVLFTVASRLCQDQPFMISALELGVTQVSAGVEHAQVYANATQASGVGVISPDGV